MCKQKKKGLAWSAAAALRPKNRFLRVSLCKSGMQLGGIWSWFGLESFGPGTGFTGTGNGDDRGSSLLLPPPPPSVRRIVHSSCSIVWWWWWWRLRLPVLCAFVGWTGDVVVLCLVCFAELARDVVVVVVVVEGGRFGLGWSARDNGKR